MSVYAVFHERVENKELFDAYLEKAVPSVAQYGGKIVAFDTDAEVVEGTLEFPQTVILEFADRDAFRAWYDSPEYQAVIGTRQKAAPGVGILAKGAAADG